MAYRPEIDIELEDTQWPMTYTDHDRKIVRAIVVDDRGEFCFVRASRDDEFGQATLIETSGGGVEPGEDCETAIRRELGEELGVEVDILRKIGVVRDYYNLIHRHNINHYFLCRARGFGARHLTQDEIDKYHLSTLRLPYAAAVAEYKRCAASRLGRLIADRELPILWRAKSLLDDGDVLRIRCFGDSNTYGFDPRDFSGGRNAAPWPERVATLTGFHVVNDGQNGRTIPCDARTNSSLCGEAAYDTDVLIVMLGTNDLLCGAEPDTVAARMEAFLAHLRAPRLMLVAPPPMRRGAWVPDDRLVAASMELAGQYRRMAARMGITFSDAGEWDIDLAYDGVHFSEAGHVRFADGIAAALAGCMEPA